MPIKLHKKLAKQARIKGFTGERVDRYAYGTMHKTGWKPSKERIRATARRLLKKI